MTRLASRPKQFLAKETQLRKSYLQKFESRPALKSPDHSFPGENITALSWLPSFRRRESFQVYREELGIAPATRQHCLPCWQDRGSLWTHVLDRMQKLMIAVQKSIICVVENIVAEKAEWVELGCGGLELSELPVNCDPDPSSILI